MDRPAKPTTRTGSNGHAAGDHSLGDDSNIRIRGARVNNLRNIDVDLPRSELIVLTGPSGSGKSSLAFDTLYAEGKRQYIESLSMYARQFLDQMARPDVDVIEGLQPTLCIDQRPGSQNPRSTVATITEIYDYLRLLMARLGTPACYQCGTSIEQQSVQEIVDRIVEFPAGTKLMVLAPMVRGRKGTHKEVFSKIRKAGFLRVRVDGVVTELDNVKPLVAQKNHHIDAVVDRILIKPKIETRLAQSVRLAVEHGEGLISICFLDESSGATEWSEELHSTRYACPECNISYEEIEPRTFSFNSPYGACPVCEGLGYNEQFDIEFLIPDPTLSFQQGAIAAWKKKQPTAKTLEQITSFLAAHQIGLDTPFEKMPDQVRQQFLYGDEEQFLGVLLFLEKELATSKSQARINELSHLRDDVTCQTCHGSRLRPEAMGVRLDGLAIHEITAMSVAEANAWVDGLDFHEDDWPIAKPLRDAIQTRVRFLSKVGLDYLSLNRSADTLSGGEFQRVRLATSIGSGLVGVCYVLDEPSIGLHSRDNQRLIDSLHDLKAQGNTVVVVEHDDAVMRIADRLIDMGPGAGIAGGRVVAEGRPQEVMDDADSLTGRYLQGTSRIEIPSKRRKTAKTRSLTLQKVTTHNLQEVNLRVPLGVLVCVTGVSGSGKSSLVNETLAPALMRRLHGVGPAPGPFKGLRGASQLDKVIRIDQSPIGRSPRSNPATYTGVFDEIRKAYAGTREAKQRGFKAGRFSFNNKEGRCPACQGHGVQKVEMSFLPDLFVECDQCHGARFNRQTLQAVYRGQSIADVLAMSIDEAAKFFENFANIARVLEAMQQVGLGYVFLGQPSTTLSGGEAQRVKLANELSRADTGQTLYLLDEPTTGLHFDDIRRLMDVLQQLVDKGNTVVVIEHNLDVIKCADWLIDLGPEGGVGGGHIIAEGTPEEVADCEASYTGRFLKEKLAR
jgi:excinuclease ABC subunit A